MNCSLCQHEKVALQAPTELDKEFAEECFRADGASHQDVGQYPHKEDDDENGEAERSQQECASTHLYLSTLSRRIGKRFVVYDNQRFCLEFSSVVVLRLLLSVDSLTRHEWTNNEEK